MPNASSSPVSESRHQATRNCFVVGPIGAQDSAVRKRSDQLLKHLIAPVVVELGYADPERADKLPEPGRITRQIIDRLMNADLVIADLTDENPNVYYELAVRHATQKPFVQISASPDRHLPFDVSDLRTIILDHHDLDSVEEARIELRAQIAAINAGKTLVDSPLTLAADFAKLSASTDPSERTQAEMIELLEEIRILTARNNMRAGQRPAPDVLADLLVLRRFVETAVGRQGRVLTSDLRSLITHETSGAHDHWVNELVEQWEARATRRRPAPDVLQTDAGMDRRMTPNSTRKRLQEE